ncbi:MAG: endosialidase [Clostridiales bacterium]|nr:endosialidase [Clostridiales bacterium]
MPVIEALIRTEEDGTISFGNYTLNTKSKLQDFEHAGDLYKIKTFYEITKLERNGSFVYESVPGTAVANFCVAGDGVSFTVEGYRSSQITVQLEEDTEYEVFVDGESVGSMETNMSGKLAIRVELAGGNPTEVRFVRKQG